MNERASDSIADAAPDNWVDRRAPPWALPYLRLSRIDRPIPVWLLLLPGWWSIALAAPTGLLPSVRLLVLFAIGALVMRGAGCTFNDIVDRDIDGRVERTRNRPLPSGQVTLSRAIAWMLLQALLGLGVLLCLTPVAIDLGIASLALVAIYPFMKRVTWWPQLFLGLAFNWGALMGWAAVRDALPPAPILLYLGGIAWTLGYDTIYAHQDKDDDALIGVKSTARLFGKDTRRWLRRFHAAALGGIALAGLIAGLGWFYLVLLLPAAAHLAWQIAALDIDDPADCLAKFRSNRDLGLLVLAAIVIARMAG